MKRRWADGGDSENVSIFKKKSLLNLLYYCFCFFMFLIFGSEACGSQLPDQERNQLHCFGKWSLNHWTTCEHVLNQLILKGWQYLLPMKQLEILMWNLKKTIWSYRCQPENLMPWGEILSHKDYWNLQRREYNAGKEMR